MNSGLNGLDSNALGASKSTPSTGLCLLTDFPIPDSLKTSVSAARTTFHRLMSLPPGSRVKTSVLPERRASKDAQGSRVSEAVYTGRPYESSMRFGQMGCA